MRLTDYLDKGASLGASAPCLTMAGQTRTYGDVQRLSWQVARALHRSGVRPGDKVAILSANDPVAFSCVFGIARAGAVWCPVNPRNQAAETRELLDLFDCTCLIFQGAFAPLVAEISPDLPKLHTLVCLDERPSWALAFADWLGGLPDEPWQADPPDDTAMIAGTGGTTGRQGRAADRAQPGDDVGHRADELPVHRAPGLPRAGPAHPRGRGPVLPGHGAGRRDRHHAVGRPGAVPGADRAAPGHPHLPAADRHLHAARPARPGRRRPVVAAMPVVRRRPDVAGPAGGGHHPDRPGAGPAVRADRGADDDLDHGAGDHVRADGALATERFASAGRPAPLVTVAIMDDDGRLLPRGERGEIVVRSSLVMAGYYRDPAATAEAGRHGWHHTGDIGYLDDDNYLFIVDRAKDMIITGGFNVYSVEVEQALMRHAAVQDCAVVGLPDDKWGERVTAVVQPYPGRSVTEADLRAFAKDQLGSVKAPKQVEVWPDLPRSKVGKILKGEVKARLLGAAPESDH